jgi:hypothetical protein
MVLSSPSLREGEKRGKKGSPLPKVNKGLPLPWKKTTMNPSK